MSEGSVERRRAPRATVDFPIQLKGHGNAREAVVKDLSSNGLCCAFPDPINEMTLVEIGLQLPGDERVHEIQGAVVRCDKRRGVHPPTYEIAVYFTELPPACRSALTSFVTARVK